MAIYILMLSTTIGFEYLSVDPIAQRVGMGYAQVGDGCSVSYNPAGLAYTVGSYYSASYLHYIADTHFGYVGYEKDQFGMGIKYFNGGSLKKTDEFGQEYGSFGVHFLDLNIGKGFFYQDFALGITVKGVYANIDTLYAAGAGVDLGALYLLSEYEIQLGLAVKNIGVGIRPFIEARELFPYEVDLGAMTYSEEGWLGMDLVFHSLMNLGLRIGGAYSIFENFELRGSYNTLLSSLRTGNNGLDFLTGLSLGFGLKLNTISVDYSYSPYFDLGECHRLSVSIGG